MNTEKIEDTDNAWEPEGPLGHDPAHARRAPDDVSDKVDEALGLETLADLRVEKEVMDALRKIAGQRGIPWQALIREVLATSAAPLVPSTRAGETALRSIADFVEQALTHHMGRQVPYMLIFGRPEGVDTISNCIDPLWRSMVEIGLAHWIDQHTPPQAS